MFDVADGFSRALATVSDVGECAEDARAVGTAGSCDVEGFAKFYARHTRGLAIERAAVEALR